MAMTVPALMITAMMVPGLSMEQPGWTWQVQAHGRECFDASTAHKPPDAPPWLPVRQHSQYAIDLPFLLVHERNFKATAHTHAHVAAAGGTEQHALDVLGSA